MIQTLFLERSLARHLFYPVCTGTRYLLVFTGAVCLNSDWPTLLLLFILFCLCFQNKTPPYQPSGLLK